MILSVAIVCDVFVPPHFRRVDAVIGKRQSLRHRPPGKRARFKAAVRNLIFRSFGLRFVDLYFIVNGAGSLLSLLAVRAHIVHGNIPVVIRPVVIDDADKQFFAEIRAQIQIIRIIIIGVIYV